MSEASYLTRQSLRYSRVTPGALYESAIQGLVERNLTALFPGYVGGRKEPLFRTALGNVQPDLVLVRDDLSGWAVVEVELETHSFSGHVLPQLVKLTEASADDALIARMRTDHLPGRELEEVAQAMSGRPKVILVMQGDSVAYLPVVKRHAVDVIDVEVHASKDTPNEYILTVLDRSISWQQLTGLVRRSPSPMTRMLWVAPLAGLPRALCEAPEIEVTLGTSRAMWKVDQSEHDVLLRQPTDLVERESATAARMFWDSENLVLRLEPVEGGNE